MIINTDGKIPIKIWSEEIEEGAMEQIKNVSNLPFGFHHVALMPDNHRGYGCPIGTVFASNNVIIPNLIGVDIGCGMCAVKTSLTEISTETLKKIMGEIRTAVPVGFGHQKEKQDESLMPFSNSKNANAKIISQEYENARGQIGTLGGGNHFIEIQKGSDGHIWIMIHSGSRNLGLKVASYYNKEAIKLNEKWRTTVPKEQELAFLPLGEKLADDYIQEMEYCVAFALANRKLMMDNIINIVGQATVSGEVGLKVSFDPMINIAHNYARMENHFGKNVMVHRKGATLATADTIGIVPGSQGTRSYIVKGKGNAESFNSCSHGAGRKMGRRQATRELNLEEEQKKLADIGVIHGIRNIKDLDEAPGAYKPIEEVMANQKDLVDIQVSLTPLAVIKG